jgi:hypothetical protein
MIKVSEYKDYVVESTGATIKYKIVNGTAYHIETPDRIIEIIEEALHSDRTICLRLCLGDTVSGKDWGETNDVTGYIGRSTGDIKVPLLLKSKRSSGGGSLLDHCIIKIYIVRGHTYCPSYHEVYRHPKYHLPTT